MVSLPDIRQKPSTMLTTRIDDSEDECSVTSEDLAKIKRICLGAQTVYLLYASDNNQNFKISRLDSNYYNVASQVSTIAGE